MFGIRFIKVQPNDCVLHYSNGRLAHEGNGLAFFYFSPTSSLVLVPMASVDVPYIFEEVTSDFQEITIQGQITYRIADPKQVSQLLNYTLNSSGKAYVSDDPAKLPQRVINHVQVLMHGALKGLPLREALTAADRLVAQVRERIRSSEALLALGLEVLDLSILAIKPKPETARALEAEAREQLLREADEAIYSRRNAAVEQERAIKENELNTEIAVENKKRQIREAQMEAEKSIQQKARQLRQADMAGQIALEGRRKGLVALATENSRREADARAYGIAAAMKAFAEVDPKVLQALASAGMDPGQLVAQAFRDLAEGADRIGQLNVTPDLLRELLQPRTKE